MIAFLIELENRPGTLAGAAEAIAGRGVNITGAAGIGGTGLVLTASDEAATRQVLRDKKYTFREIELVPLTLVDKPGSLAQACRSLANAGINLEAVFAMTSKAGVTMAFATSDPAKTRSILG